MSVPSSATVDVGQLYTVSASVSGGTSPYTYAWYFNSILDPTQTGSSYSYTATTSDLTAGSFTISVTVTDFASNVCPSNIETVTVDSTPSISMEPSSAIIDSGQSTTLTSTVTGGTGPFTWQWYVTNGQIPGASGTGTTATYTVSATNTGIYVVFTDTNLVTATSSSVTVTVNSALVAPTVSAYAATVDQTQTSTLTSSAVTTGTGPYTYQWMADAPGAGSYSNIGTNSSSYNFITNGTTFTGAWSFKLQVTDNAGAIATSNVVTVTVNTAPTASVSPTSWTMDIGQSATFTAITTGGSGNYTSYQWYVNGQLAQSGTASVMPFTRILGLLLGHCNSYRQLRYDFDSVFCCDYYGEPTHYYSYSDC